MITIFKDDNKSFMLFQTKLAAQVNPVLGNPLNHASVLQNVALQSGVNVINHLLGRQMNGWFLTDKQGAAEIYRSAPLNGLTLTLTSNAAVTVNIGVF